MWREGKQLVYAMDNLKKDIEANLRAYVDKREAAFAAMIPALRKNDQAAFAEAMNTMSEAEGYLNKLKAPQ
jgi:hypothetical protein